MSRAAIIQMTSSTSVSDNLIAAYDLLRQAAAAGAMLAVLPENFVLMGQHERDKFAVAEQFGAGPVQTWLANTARELKLWIVAGTIPLKLPHESRVAAACLVINSQGECVARYDKMHLFDVDVDDATGSYRESATLAPGNEPVVVDTPLGRLGLAICYDVRFPELFRMLSAKGAQLLTLPAAFTVPTGKAHWEILLRARAIENLSFLLAPAQTGLHANGRETYGHSMIIDPWGEVLAVRSAEPGFVIADIDLERQATLRRRFPALSHRRL
jgi:predicted amidohydrolase